LIVFGCQYQCNWLSEKTRLRYDLLCVRRDVKPYTLTTWCMSVCVQPVVATTCLGVSNSALFSRRTFDVCIVDEASQVSLLASLNPLFHSRRFVLVGDDKQLPPVVHCHQARSVTVNVTLNSASTFNSYKSNQITLISVNSVHINQA